MPCTFSSSRGWISRARWRKYSETRRSLRREWRWRAIVAGAFVIWAAANFVDNVRLIRLAAVEPPLDERRALTDYLIDHHIRYARAIYWDAYMIDFLSRERVITSSIDTIRIPEYQKEVDDHGDAAVVLERVPCEGPVKVGAWCVGQPGK